MKLIIREYLASLRERNELDLLLPDLLSQMGLEVFSKPGLGNRQYGVDVAAYGAIEDGEAKVYLFSAKPGDLGRKDWNSGLPHDLQPSLDDIVTTYIPTHLPPKYQSKPIEICICFGGDMKEEIRLSVSSYEKKNTTDRISFSEWGGERLSAYIEAYLLKEELLPESFHRQMRKTLAMLDEPDVSIRHFRELVNSLRVENYSKTKDRLTSLRQLYLALWIIYSWCREQDNIESAYQASEIALLNAWELCKPHLGKKNKASVSILETLNAIIYLHIQIISYFLEEKIIPYAGNLHAISASVRPSTHLDTNLKLFDLLGRIGLLGLWFYWFVDRIDPGDGPEFSDKIILSIAKVQDGIKKLIVNNPTLFTPYKDDQAIDIVLATLFLAVDPKNHRDLNGWFSKMIGYIYYLFQTNGPYPCNLNRYYELLEHPNSDDAGYKEKVTQGSILYPYIAIFAALFGLEELYAMVQKLREDHLPHCNFQVWYPDESSEENYYANLEMHGATLSHIAIEKEPTLFLRQVFDECDESSSFHELSATKYNFWPLTLIASRHYRLPVPVHYFLQFMKKREQKVDAD